MTSPRRLSLSALVLFSISFVASAQAQQRAPSRDHQLLTLRAERPAEPPGPGRAALLGVGPGSLLFSMTGPDNAPIVRALPDVTGDGKDEVIVGIDESGVPNIFCLDGASVGTADVVWSIQTADGVSGGSPYGDDCLALASDSDGNGAMNLLAGTAWGGRTAYHLDGGTGAILWRFDTYQTAESGWVYSLTELNDTNGDGENDYAFATGSFSDGVYLIDGASTGGGQANFRWRWYAGDASFTVRNLGDANGDGKHDVLAAVGEDVDDLVALSGGSLNGSVLWTYEPATSVWAAGLLPDITGDAIPEALAVLWTVDGSAIRCVNGATGAFLWASTAVGAYGMMVDALPDVTGDGKAEVIVSSWENAVTVLSGADGSLVWKTFVGTTNGGDVWTARAIGDLDGDGFDDVVAGSFDYHVYALSGATGEIFWAYDTGNRVFSVHPVGDLDGDGRPEVAAGTQDTNSSVVLYVLDGNAGIALSIFADGFETGDTSAWGVVVP
ncbi:MAG TPA: FG-GAP-like repeat-containing protein [Thermoanaerobaculia bacterium]|nr:FG-GAP-like repeat-containing protein [Thermoanaerobaculia bacterium]